MLNLYLKTISESLSEKLKKALLDLISSRETTYFKNRHIREGGGLISNVIEIGTI